MKLVCACGDRARQLMAVSWSCRGSAPGSGNEGSLDDARGARRDSVWRDGRLVLG